jgi:dihydrolipoamide dehydrogenase
MRTGLGVEEVAGAIHAHPTLSRVVESAFRDVPSRTRSVPE